MLEINYYHIGFIRDHADKSVWRRVGDHEPVKFSPDGWLNDNSKPDADYVEWYYSTVADNDYKNWVVNFQDQENYFICEY